MIEAVQNRLSATSTTTLRDCAARCTRVWNHLSPVLHDRRVPDLLQWLAQEITRNLGGVITRTKAAYFIP